MTEFHYEIAKFSREMIIKAVETVNPLDNKHSIDCFDIDKEQTDYYFELDNEYSSGNVIQGQVMRSESGKLMGFICIIDLVSEAKWQFSYADGLLRPTHKTRWGNA